MPRASYDGTVDDLETLPDDGLQYELLDAACPKHLKVFFAPLDWQPDRRTSLQPDLLVIARDSIGATNVTRPLALAVLRWSNPLSAG